tara:strand:+ start:67 stop:1722 length:1656 start_codon:yes stop_codon:yes gene_type:complete
MKRLLAYLFIVLGLGLILSDDSNAEIKKNLIFCINTGYPSATDVYIKQQLEYNKTFKSPDICSSNQSSLVEIGYNEWKKRFRSSRFYLRRDGDSICVSPPYNCDGNGNTRIEHTGENFYKDYKNKKTQVAKVEPSETREVELQMVAKVFSDQYSDTGQSTTFFSFSDTKEISLNDKKSINNFYRDIFNKTIDKCNRLNTTFKDGICTLTSIRFLELNKVENNKVFVDEKGFKFSTSLYDLLQENNVQTLKDELINDPDKIKALISKAKNPEQGSYSFGDSENIVSRIISNKISTCLSLPLGIPATEKDLIVRVKLLLNYDGSINKTEILNHSRLNQPGQGFYKVLAESVLRAIKLCAPYKVKINKNKEILIKVDARNILFGEPSIEDKKTIISKSEPSKKQKVAKKNSSTAFVYLKTSDVINFGFRVEIADLDILFLDNGKCKVDISLFYIFENYNQRNNCFWTVVEDDKKISVEYDFYGVKRNYIFYKDNVNNVGDILAYRPPKNKAYKIYPYDKSYPLKLALKFNVRSFIDNNSYDDININQTNISAPN